MKRSVELAAQVEAEAQAIEFARLLRIIRYQQAEKQFSDYQMVVNTPPEYLIIMLRREG